MGIFNNVPITRISRSVHGLSHQVKASFDAGGIYPIMTELALPGDKWTTGLEQFVRTMPMIAPLMDRMDIKVDAFFVPLRLIWDDFEDYITLGPSGEFNVVKPKLHFHGTPGPNDDEAVAALNLISGTGGLGDYLNFPSINWAKGQETEFTIDALPFRAYQFIYNEYFRNENLEEEIPIVRTSGVDDVDLTTLDPELSYTNFLLRYRGWRKDYFTSALPNPQKGPAVRMPGGTSDLYISSEGPLVTRPWSLSDDELISKSVKQYDNTFYPTGADGVPVSGYSQFESDQNISKETHTSGKHNALTYQSGLKIVSDSENGATAATIEELRYAETLQEFYEANARGGSRYKEYLMNIWHTRSKDSRLDRPEYLGGYRGPITISDIDQTSQSDISAQATPAGKGLSAGGSRLFRFKVPEFGIIMVTMSVLPKSSYFQGFRRWNLYDDCFDFPNPFFANLGEQEIFNKELYYDPTDGEDDDTFGYAPRYSEAKYIPDSVHGQFRSTLDYWHLARKFSSRPNLNEAFVHVNPLEVSRAFPNQVANNDKFVGTFFFHIKRAMYLPYYGVPRLIHSV